MKSPPVFANLNEAFARIESRTNLEKGFAPGNPNREYRLDRMQALASLFGNPQESCRVIHVAGSKGKGSTSVCLAALAAAGGLKTGVYASPHLVDYRERFRLWGEDFPEETLLSLAREVEAKTAGEVLPGEGPPTTFEILTLLAFLLFRETRRDLVILETGLGGRLDATNIVRPEAGVITPIEREHTEILGDTLEEIAREKAGIIKPGMRVYSSRQLPEVQKVLQNTCREKQTPLITLSQRLEGMDPLPPAPGEIPGLRWELRERNKPPEKIVLGMPGAMQAENAALAITAARDLFQPKPPGSLTPALSQAVLPGRTQILRRRPPVMIDGAHTPQSIQGLLDVFFSLNPEEPVLLFGMVTGKEGEAMARLLAPRFAGIIVSTPGFFKPSDPGETAGMFQRHHPAVWLQPDPSRAWEEALTLAGSRKGLLVTGSFYMAAEAARLGIPQEKKD